MKRLILIISLLGGGWQAYAQSQTDSVVVEVHTSVGAEITLDGESSSTNFITKRVAAGHHKAVVSYGGKPVKEYDVEVTPDGDRQFDFPIEGKLTVTSNVRKAKYKLDGMELNGAPVQMPLLGGDHELAIIGNPDLYHPFTETFDMEPFLDKELQYKIKKRRPKMYGFLIANYAPGAHAVGGMLGLGRRLGGYMKLEFCAGGELQRYEYPGDSYPINVSRYNNGIEAHLAKSGYFLSAGLTYRIIPQITVFAGSGYGSFAPADKGYYPYGVSGVLADCGVIYRWKCLLLEAGYKRIMAESQEGGYHCGEFEFGIGLNFHKEKHKRKK